MNMRTYLDILLAHGTLGRAQAREALAAVGRGECNEHQVTAFMSVYLMRSIAIEELEGFRDALLDLCVPADLGTTDLVDVVGTGGDGKDTFNISTLACFVVAGAGQRVAKHGNYGASSVSGASNVMERLGYRFKSDAAALRRELAEAGICFLHAPLFHPALKNVGPIRRNLGMRTFFNMLGPLVNPARPDFSLIGVYSLEMARIYTYLLQRDGRPFTVIHGLDGYDEASLTNDTKVVRRDGEEVLSPEYLGRRRVFAADLASGGSPEAAATRFRDILEGRGSWAQNAVVLANAALALHGTGRYADYPSAYAAAVDSLDTGRALRCLQTLLSLQ
jgi:anthranilate phosphoribosyltransferase